MNASKAEFRAAKEATGPESISVLSLLRGHRFDPYERWTLIRRDHGPVAHYHYGIFNNFFISSAEGAKRVLQDNIGNYTKEHTAYKMVRRLVGNGLLTSEGSFWLRQRRLAQPAFHRDRIARMANLMTAAALETAERWEAKATSGEPVSMMNEMSTLTLKVVGDALFGAAVSAQAATVAESFEVLSQQMVERFSRLRLLPPVLPTKYDREFRRARGRMFSVVDEIIADKRAHGESDDLLSMFMQARDEDTGERMSDAQLRDEVTTMLLAGHETTAVVLAWVWALLGDAPLPSGLYPAAPRQGERRCLRLSSLQGRLRGDQPSHPPPASVLLGKARRFPARAVDGLRRREPAAPLRVHPLQRWTPPMYRRQFLEAGVDPVARHARSTLPADARRRRAAEAGVPRPRPARGRGSDDPAPASAAG